MGGIHVCYSVCHAVVEKEIYSGVLMLVVSLLHDLALQMDGATLSMAKIVYSITVKETYAQVSDTNMLGHVLQVHLVEGKLPPVAQGIDIPDFGPIADMFLADKEINVRAVPDFIERQLYINILSMLYGASPFGLLI
eukprot:1797368-Pyramimonas_sp.AAC.2